MFCYQCGFSHSIPTDVHADPAPRSFQRSVQIAYWHALDELHAYFSEDRDYFQDCARQLVVLASDELLASI